MGWVPFAVYASVLAPYGILSRLCICVGPLWHFKVVLRHFSICSCILHYNYALLHDRCLLKCPSDILVLNWTQVSSNDRFLSCLIMLTMFWSFALCFTHFAHVAHTRHILGLSRHTSCISCCTHMHQHMLSTNTHMHKYLFYALWLYLLGLMLLACWLCLFTLFLSCFCSVFKLLYLCFELTCV